MAAKAYARADYAAARGLAQSGVNEAEAAGRKGCVALFLRQLGDVDESLARYTDALSQFQYALTLDRQIEDDSDQTEDRCDDVTPEDSSPPTSIGGAAWMLLGGLAGSTTSKHQIAVAFDLAHIGALDEHLGSYDEALTALKEALVLSRSGVDQGVETDSLVSIANVYEDEGRHGDALDSLHLARTLAEKNKDRPREATVYRSIANVDQQLNQFADALELHQQAQVIHEAINDQLSEAEDLSNIAAAKFGLGNYGDAVVAAKSAVDLNRKIEHADIWRPLELEAHAETKLGASYESDAIRDYGDAISNIEQLWTTIGRTGDRFGFFKTVISCYDDYIAYLLDLNDRYPSRDFGRQAFEIFEHRAGRAALEQIASSAAEHFAGISSELVLEDQAADAGLQTAEENYTQALTSMDAVTVKKASTELDQAQARQKALDAMHKELYPKYYQLRYPKPISLTALQHGVLKGGELMLVYHLLPVRSTLWIVSRDHFEVVRLASTEEIDGAVHGLLAHIRNIQTRAAAKDPAISSVMADDVIPFARDSNTLYAKIVPRQAASAILSAKQLIIVPSGALFAVPFAALSDSAPAPGEQPKYLLSRVPISYASSATQLSVVRQSFVPASGVLQLLALAPTFTDPSTALRGDEGSQGPLTPKELLQFGALPNAQHEVQRVASYFPYEARVLLADQASRTGLLARNDIGDLRGFRYLLFSTHAIVPDTPNSRRQPAIVLAHPEAGGFLTMGDVLGLSLNADLVTLSACETGLVIDTGDGLSGLTRAFLFAGARSVSVTLWNAYDPSSSELVPAFYSQLGHGTPPATALQAAQLNLSRSPDPTIHHPFAWAAFVIFGDAAIGSSSN